ncbi:MAG TPA: hypothetical protein VFS07_10150, partial [Gemmatimonadales bacterium]|nr:hypothetical protein [Gemmatimonadales bacterium]
MHRRVALTGLLLCAAAPLAAQSSDPWAALRRPNSFTPRPTTGAITENDLRSRIFRFAADSMQGRLLGAPGNVKGTDYIAAELRRLGLEPAGENGTYFQTLPLVSRGLDTTSALTVGDRTFRPWGDFIPRDQGPGTRAIAGVPVVWGGDFSDTTTRLSAEAAAGKLVVLVSSAPVPGNPPGVPNRGEVNTLYRNAAGVAIIALDGMPAADVEGFQQPLELILGDENPALPAYLYISKAMGEALMGGPTAGLATGAAGRPVAGEVRWVNTPSPNPARNVVAILRGSDPALRNEYVAIGAHNDHVGTGRPVAHDSVYIVNHLFRQQGAEDPPVDSLT